MPPLPEHAADEALGEDTAGEEGDEEYGLLPGASSGEDDEETLDEEDALAAAEGDIAHVRVDEGKLQTMTSCWSSGLHRRESMPLPQLKGGLLIRCRESVQRCCPQ